MFRRTFKVKINSMKNNFVQLPREYYCLVSSYENGCLSLSFGTKVHYISWVPYTSTLKDTEIGINAKVAKEIGLKENDLVKCTLIQEVMSLKSVYATPVSAKDWEIIELSSERIQTTLLDQTKIVNSTQVLIVWINKTMQVCLHIDRIKPNLSYGKIENDTELIIAPYLAQTDWKSTASENLTDKTGFLSKSQTTIDFPLSSAAVSRSSTMNFRAIRNNELSQRKVVKSEQLGKLLKDLKKESSRSFEFRVVAGKWEEQQISDIFVTKNNLPEFMDLEKVYLLKTAQDKEYYVNVKVVADNENFPNNVHPAIEINENLMKLLMITELQKVSLRPKQVVLNFVEKLTLFANKKTNYKIIEQSFKRFLINNTKFYPMLLNQDQILRLEDDLIVSVRITPEHFRYCLVDKQILKESKIYAADVVQNVESILDYQVANDAILSRKDFIEIDKFNKIFESVSDSIKVNLCLDVRNSVLTHGNIIIAGSANCGKSVMVERICDNLGKKPYCCYYDIFYCTRSKGRKPESIQKDLRQIFTLSLQNAPAIVVLENLDVLAHSVGGDQQTQDGEYFNRIADTIQHLIFEFTTKNNAISVIATVNDVQHLNRRIYASRGKHLFQLIEKMPELDRNDREIILSSLCDHVDSSELNIEKFANLTEGYNIGDLVQFTERAIFYAYRINSSRPILTNELLAKSLENTNSYCLQVIQSNNRVTEVFDSERSVDETVAGLEEVVSVLEEVLRWPVKFPMIFDKSPLRNQAGVLLFGPPGTGKTFLVSQISEKWNLRIISVKGPELLAKYIGQSEENVRNLFNRARTAKPCVLFFDEFDSLAPKRGHDSTGVTDRVVNQLLTELDGVEGLQGVTVIAATSRPDLLDPALLRSGRIDRLVECPVPNFQARLKIFTVLSQSLHLDKSADIQMLAMNTEQYTGADIQSILTTANMMAVKEAIASHQNAENLPEKIFLKQNVLVDALKNTRPSLSAQDIARYKQTYARFTNKEKQPRDFVSKRSTLA